MSVKSELSHPDLHVTRTPSQVKNRTVALVTGLSPHRTLGVHNGDIDTLACALLERMYYCKVGGGYEPAPEVKYADITRELGEFGREIVRGWRATPVSAEELLAMYSGRKRTIYEEAYESLCSTPVSRADALIKAFVKVEKANVQKAPRCIQPRNPRYNFRVGQFIKPIEHRLYRRIARIFGDGPTVMKGYTVEEVARIMRGKWDSFEDPVAVGLDATKFDMHVCEAMLRWEHSVYEAIYGNDKALRELLRWQRHNKGVGYAENGKLRYRVKGKRASGDMNTALGNCLIMCGLIWRYAQVRGVPVKLVNNGDDCVVFMERRHLEEFSKDLDSWFFAMGFRMTVEPPAFDFERIEFCQMRPIQTQRGWVMVRNIATALRKDTMCTMPLDGRVARKWMRAVGECGLALCAGVPVMQSFYQAYYREGVEPGKMVNAMQLDTGLRRMRGKLEAKMLPVTDAARLAVFVAWDITPEEQVALERYFDSWSFDPSLDEQTQEVVPTVLDGIGVSW